MSEEKNTSANAIVIYQSMYKQFLRLSKKNPEMAIEYITALLKYGFEGIEPDEDSDVMMYGFDADKIALDNAAVRYLKAQENGAKGGRPTKRPPAAELQQKYEELRTWAAVATYYGVTERTIRNWREVDENGQCPAPEETGKNRAEKTSGTLPEAEKTGGNLDIDIEIETEKEKDPLAKWDKIAYGYLPPHLVPKAKTRNSS